MLNKIVKLFTGKELVLYDRHRQTLPLVTNLYNKNHYIFITANIIWKYIPFRSSGKRKHQIMYVLLNCIRPRYIISMNWISKRESLYKVWTNNHPNSKFIVVQHGSYVGGTVTDIAHRFTKCDVFLVWGKYFEKQFENYNKGKKVQIKIFGNTVYNIYDRKHFEYKNVSNGKILILPTALDDHSILFYYKLIKWLETLSFIVEVKPHARQGVKIPREDQLKYPEIKGVNKIFISLHELLPKNKYDFVISDCSSALLDAVFFKNRVIYFDSKNNLEHTTYFSKYLKNLFLQDFCKMSQKDFYSFLDIDKQEELFADMISKGNNEIK